MSGLYAVTRQQLASGTFAWAAGSYHGMLVGASYAPDFEAHTTVANVPAASRLVPPIDLTGVTLGAGGYCQADDLSWANVKTAEPIGGLLISEVTDGYLEHDQLVLLLTDGDGFGLTADNVPVFVTFDAAGIWRP